MGIRILNPVAKPQMEVSRRPLRIKELRGQRLGLLFNGHVSSVKFWRHLEASLSELYRPASVLSLRKENTFAPAAAQGEISKIAGLADVAITGVGA